MRKIKILRSTPSRGFAPERIIYASTRVNVRTSPSLTDDNYLVCGCVASSHLQAGNLLPLSGEFLQQIPNTGQRPNRLGEGGWHGAPRLLLKRLAFRAVANKSFMILVCVAVCFFNAHLSWESSSLESEVKVQPLCHHILFTDLLMKVEIRPFQSSSLALTSLKYANPKDTKVSL